MFGCALRFLNVFCSADGIVREFVCAYVPVLVGDSCNMLVTRIVLIRSLSV